MAKRYTKKQVRQVKNAVKTIKKASPGSIFLAFIILAVAIGGYFIYNKFFKDPYIAPKGEIEFHFMQLNYGTSGDCIYIKAGDNDILIDGGSYYSSLDSISSYINSRMTDNKIEYLIVTHAHEDHIACLGGSGNSQTIFDLYDIGVIIDFPLTDNQLTTDKGNDTLYGRYVKERDAEIQLGAKHYTALECYTESEEGAQKFYNLSDDGNIKLEILYNYYYENQADKENNYSVCVQFHHGSRKFLFTGDLEDDGEEYLVANNNLKEVDLYKAGHHGSRTSSNDVLLSVIKPKICVISGVAGDKYGFPHQETINRLASNGVNKVYMTMKKVGDSFDAYNGDIVVSSSSENGVKVTCSNDDKPLKDTEWLIQNRIIPDAWKLVA
ncbi:MAG: MBL fold metallo-hydrolase [Clostridia bacterium]|nr:MBL fold metallo-hydrolase [Clostridia bacterium]